MLVCQLTGKRSVGTRTTRGQEYIIPSFGRRILHPVAPVSRDGFDLRVEAVLWCRQWIRGIGLCNGWSHNTGSAVLLSRLAAIWMYSGTGFPGRLPPNRETSEIHLSRRNTNCWDSGFHVKCQLLSSAAAMREHLYLTTTTTESTTGRHRQA